MLKFSGSILDIKQKKYFKNHKLSLEFNWENHNMTYLLLSKILREKLLDFKVKGWIVNCPKHKGRKVFLS